MIRKEAFVWCRLFYVGVLTLPLVTVMTGCAASPPKSGPAEVCSSVFSLGKWLVAERIQNSPWSQQTLIADLTKVKGSETLQKMVNGAYDVNVEDDDSVSWRQLQTITFAQQWQSRCIKAQGVGYQPSVWPALWRKSFIEHRVTMPFY